ncbi:MAG: 4'-phosphopantetheinyl transferase superfamily protein [Omnitrophica bacterium]|nr:4'-phosphopantetheinyl transferase superfamily protein [Candidatus Omnitrophota bacterium]
MVGIGCDIERIDRFKRILKNKNFLCRIFTKCEIRYCLGNKNPELYLARKFACKEAVFKALGSLGQSLSLDLIEISSLNGRKSIARIQQKSVRDRYKILLDVSDTGKLVFASSIASELPG